jgi:hypothetical protein
MVSSGMLRGVALVRTDISEEPSASFIRVTRIGELGTALDLFPETLCFLVFRNSDDEQSSEPQYF